MNIDDDVNNFDIWPRILISRHGIANSLMASGKSKSAKEVTSVFGTLVRVAEPEDPGGPGCVRIKTVKKSGKEEDVHEENGVLFWVNKSGFPIDNKTWDRMWDHVARIHPDGYDVTHRVRDKKELPTVNISIFTRYALLMFAC